MSTDAPATPPRKNRRVWRWLLAGVLLFLAWFCWQLFGPNPPIIVSRETTYITEPLGPDGLPDYEKYMLEKLRDGVTPENNAAVLLWQALATDDDDNATPEDRKAWASELGMAQVPNKRDALLPLFGERNREAVAAFLNNLPANRGSRTTTLTAKDEVVYDAISESMESPWTSAQLPPLFEWVAANEKQLNELVEGSKRTRYYSPSLSLINGTNESLLAMTFDGISHVRDVARTLSVRAMWNIGEGNYDRAWQDILAIYRWSRLVSQCGTLIDQLVAIAIDGIASADALALLSDRDLPSDTARKIQRDLAELPDISQMARCLNNGERLFAVDMVIANLQGPATLLVDINFEENDPFRPLDYVSFDWNVVLRRINAWYDRVAEVGGLATYTARDQALAESEQELGRMASQFKYPTAWIGGLISRERRSGLLAENLLSLSASSNRACLAAEDRANNEMALTRLASALAVYRAEHGAYPEKLDALVPDVLPELPVDLYYEKPFVYRRDGEGYLLYSAGPNGQDDGGSNRTTSILAGRYVHQLDPTGEKMLWEQIPEKADDLAIRVPTPPFKLPEPEHLAPGQ